MKAIKVHVLFMLILITISCPVYASDEKNTSAAEKPVKKENASEAAMSVPVNAPLFSPLFANFPIASVEDDTITLRDLGLAIDIAHRQEDSADKTAGKISYRDILDRLVTVRLIVHEARNMGLDELPEAKATIEANTQQYLRKTLLDHAAEHAKPDDKEVEKFYKIDAMEYKINSALFKKEEDAKKAAEEIKGGKDFNETIKKCIESGQATGMAVDKYLKRRDLTPEIAQAVVSMQTGTVSPVTRIESGFVLFKLEDARVPTEEDTAAREMARQESLRLQKFKAVTELKEALFKKYVKLDKKLLESIDYEAKPGFFSKESAFDKYLKDDRVIAEIQGEQPLTVSMLTKAIKERLYHGVKSAYENKSINEKKMPVFSEFLEKKLELKEAKSQGLDKTDESQAALKDMEYSVLFNLFLEKAVVPDVHPTDEDLKAYYESHKKDFTQPAMVRLNSLAFQNRKGAEAALARLRKGTDFDWMKANAAGMATDAGELTGGRIPVVVTSLPEGLRKAVDGASPGDYRLYSAPQGPFYAVLITQVIPEKVQSLEEVSQKIRFLVNREQLNKSLQTWAAKLRDAYTVKIYLGDKQH
jgi:parvulin-like peptidyl-prolyl isomerase